MYFKGLLEAFQRRAKRWNEPVTQADVQTLFAKHGRRWQQLPPERQEEFNLQAETWRKAREEQLYMDEQEALGQQLILALRREEAAAEDAKMQLTYSSCRLSEEDIRLWQELYEDLMTHPQALKERRTQAALTPCPLDPPAIKKLEELPVVIDVAEEEPVPGWVSALARRRHCIRPCGIRINLPDGQHIMLKVLFCKQSPLEVHMLQLSDTDPLVPDDRSPLPAWLEHQRVAFTHNFTYKAEDIKRWKDLPRVSSKDIDILQYLVFRPGEKLCSSFDFLPLD
eukprot:7846927-Lingulodinium_polyedra.AAC.1